MTHPVVDAHCHIFQEVRGQVAAGPTSGLGYGRMAVGETQMQMLPPYNPRTEFTAEMLVANMDWAGVDRAVLLQGTFYGECDDYTLAALRAYPGRLAGALFADPRVEPHLVPALDRGRFCRPEVGSHRKAGPGQIEGSLPVRHRRSRGTKANFSL